MPETPETPLTHVRGTTFRVTGWVKKLGAASNDITGDTLHVMLSEADRQTPLGVAYTLTSPSAALTLFSSGKFTIRLDAGLFSTAALPDHHYWLQVDLTDTASGDVVCVGRATVELLDNPRA